MRTLPILILSAALAMPAYAEQTGWHLRVGDRDEREAARLRRWFRAEREPTTTTRREIDL